MSERTHIARFGEDDIANVLARLSNDEIDQLTFGAIQLDIAGRVVGFNLTEAGLVGRSREEVMGRMFFDEIAPCTRRPEFRGRFQDIVTGKIDGALFEYTFDYKMNPTRVYVHMKRALDGQLVWVLVRRRDAPAL